MTPLVAASIPSTRVRHDPSSSADAGAMHRVLDDPSLYTFIGGHPPTLAELERRYRALAAGSGRRDESWLNWVVRDIQTEDAIGFTQATVESRHTQVAWLIGTAFQGRGLAKESSRAMVDWLRGRGIGTFEAHIHRDHRASQAVATVIGLVATGDVDDAREEIWRSGP